MFDEEKKRRKLIKRYLHIKKGFIKNVLYSILKRKGIYISRDAMIGKNLFFVHPYNLFIGKGAIIGDDCTIYHNVTIGKKNERYPIIGNNVTIFPHSILIGDISIGNQTIIGAGSVAIQSFPDKVVVAGNPAKVIENE